MPARLKCNRMGEGAFYKSCLHTIDKSKRSIVGVAYRMKADKSLLRYSLVVGIIVCCTVLLSLLFGRINMQVRWYITAAVLAAEVMVDCFTTIYILKSNLGVKEANPVHALLMKKLGYAGDFIFLVALLSLILVFTWPRVSGHTQLGICCAYTLVYVNNAIVYRRKLKAKRLAERYVELTHDKQN